MLMYALGLWRLLSASFVLVALVIQSLQGSTIVGDNPLRFFSFFTVDSALFAIAIFFLTGLTSVVGKKDARYDFVRGASVLYMLMTATLYLLFLPQIYPVTARSIPWVDFTVHYCFPFVVILDWLIDVPHNVIEFTSARMWLLFPIVYLMLTLLYGDVTGWYPYTILDPGASNVHKFIITIGVICCVMLVFTWLVARVSTRKNKLIH